MGMSVTQKKIEALAPDQASLNAARKLLQPSKWPLLAQNADETLAWAECQGSGSTPYRVSLDLSDLGYKCSCPSRKFPCKHALALMWLRAEGKIGFETGDVPSWTSDWLARRRKPADGPAAAEKPGRAGPSPSLAQTAPEAGQEEDEEAAKRAEAQRRRTAEAREGAVLAGLEDLDRWLHDQIDHGLAAFMQNALPLTRQMAQRMVDAKAPGIAAALDELPQELFTHPEEERLSLLIERLGGLHLLAEAYRRQDALGSPLRADVRRLVGWSSRREDVLSDPDALRCRGAWLVVASRSTIQPDRLRRIEIWLMRTGDQTEGPRFAQLLDFVPVATSGASQPFLPGEHFEAELVFYPSSQPLRALIGARGRDLESEPVPTPGRPPSEALDDYFTRLAAQPWLPVWPLILSGVAVVRTDTGALVLAGSGDEPALPLPEKRRPELLPLLGLEDLSMAGLWDGRTFEPMAAFTPIGNWWAD